MFTQARYSLEGRISSQSGTDSADPHTWQAVWAVAWICWNYVSWWLTSVSNCNRGHRHNFTCLCPQRWLTIWLVVSVAFLMQYRTYVKDLKFDGHSNQCGYHLLHQNHYLIPHWRLFCKACSWVVLLQSISTPHNPSPWLPSRSSSESSAQQRVRRGSGKGWFIQGSRLPRLVPHSSISWQFSLSTWPVSTLNPCRSVWVFGYNHTCQFTAAFWSWMSNFVSSHCCVSLHLAVKFLSCVSCGCIYLKQLTWLCPVLPFFLHC